jgi:hypothetical protein
LRKASAATDGRKGIYFTDHGAAAFLRELNHRGFNVVAAEPAPTSQHQLTPLAQLRAFCAVETSQNPGRVHIAVWALAEIERLRNVLGVDGDKQ